MSRQVERAKMRRQGMVAVISIAGYLPRRVRREAARALAKSTWLVNYGKTKYSKAAAEAQGRASISPRTSLRIRTGADSVPPTE